ncbi:MAG TPA: outer membrane protein assembly factor BamA [Bryobacteraceae bacterium]|jgi:outer membrane protein insertion porin family|nr:outer membrane protein assembly factor BamA [Bryobacteraceae bacterium]
MISLRPLRLKSVFVCLCGLAALVTASGQQPPAAQPPAQQPPQQPAQQPPQPAPPPAQPRSPFETIPQAEPPKPAQPPAAPQFEAPKPAEGQAQPPLGPDIIEGIEFPGVRRVPQDTLRAMIFSKVGNVYNEDTMKRDFMVLWNTNRFADIRLETEKGDRGGVIVRFVVTERPVIRDIKYEGAKSVTTSDILDRFKERKVGLTVESQYDPNVVNHAAVVLKDLVAEHGHQFATVTPELHRIPPSSLEVVFNVVEGPKIKVGKITILGNEAFSQRDVIRAMKNLHPIGIPYSIFLEDLFAKTFDASKLEEDKERVRDAYQKQGYFTAKALDEKLNIRDVGGALGGIHIPIIKENKPGKVEDITLPVEEGQRYYLADIKFEGVKLFRSTDFLGNLFQMKAGDVFSTEKLRNGLKNLTKVYSQFGYIDYVAEPQIDIVPNSDKINLTLNADEGKQFFVRRIDFTGNTTTRDKVIRREILIDEGDVYNSTLWDASILHLNQLGYFEALKENESYTLNRNAGTNTVDINLKVKERGKNSIGLNGGVSGISGTFIGLNYSTNNFLGLGETLTMQSQVGTLQDQITLGFTEPYLFDRPLQAGVSVYLSRFNYDQGRQISLLSGVNLESFYNALGSANVLNYIQNSKGVSLSASYPIKRSFARLGISIGYDDSSIITKSTGAQTYFTYLNFLGVNGPNALNGIKTLSITPSYSYSSKNSYQNPTAGKSIFFSVKASGSVLGANVNTIQPTLDVQYFHPSPRWHKNVLAFHLLATTITGYGGKVAPPFSRAFIGGENDIRGFDFYSVTPIAYIPSNAQVNIFNSDGSQRVQNQLVNGYLTPVNVTQNIPIYQVITPGGDSHAVFNFEYRIPIFGPVTLVPFYDVGANRILFPNQLTVNPGQVANLNAQFPSAAFTNQVKIAPGTQAIRMSTGLEIDVVLPIVQAPFRVYYAYNPSVVREYLQPPIVADFTQFPNAATLNNAIASYGTPYPLFEKRGTFRFTIGRTF